MSVIKILYRDVDRTPYLYTVKHAAARYGLELQFEKATSPEFGEFLEAGSVDFLAENYWGLQSFRARGVPFISVATAVTWLNEKLFVHPSIVNIEDLRGKKFAIRGVGPSQLIPGLWLKDHGLGADVQRIVYSEKEVGRWGHWKKVVSGECHGCFVTNFYQNEPAAAGLKLVPVEPYGFIGNVTLTTTEGFIERRRSEVQHLVTAAFEASQLFKHDAATALAICKKEPSELLKIENEKQLEFTYQILRDELSEAPLPSPEGISNTMRMRLDSSPELTSFNPVVMWDFSFAREAMKRRGGE